MTQLQTTLTRYYRLVFVTSSILIIAFIATLARVIKGTKHSFLIVLTLMFAVSNLCAILSNTFAKAWIENP